MKKILLILSVFALAVACVPEDENRINFHIEFIPIESVEVPQLITPGHTYPIKVTFRRPNDCHYLDGFYYEAVTSTRIVAVQTIFIEDTACEPIDAEEPETLSFRLECPLNYAYDKYHFKFYKGEDAQGNQQYLEIEIPVRE